MEQKKILIIDDDADVINIYKRCFIDSDQKVESAENGMAGLEKVRSFDPDLIILDIKMPVMNGYEFCAELMKREGEIAIPIIFATSERDNDNSNAFAYGAVDYIIKPFARNELFDSINRNIDIKEYWRAFLKSASGALTEPARAEIGKFMDFAAGKLKLSAQDSAAVTEAGAENLYLSLEELNVNPDRAAMLLADFYKMDYLPFIDPESVILGGLPVAFMQKHKMAAIMDARGKAYYVIAEPFDEPLITLLKGAGDKSFAFAVTEPDNIAQLFFTGSGRPGVIYGDYRVESSSQEAKSTGRLEGAGAARLADLIMAKLCVYGGSSAVVEQLNKNAAIKFSGYPPVLITIKTAAALVSRFKSLCGLSKFNNTKPQKGSFALDYLGKRRTITVTTGITPSGENCEVKAE